MTRLFNYSINGLIFLSCLTSYWRFKSGFPFFKRIQKRKLTHIYKTNRETDFFNELTKNSKESRASVPLTTWSDYEPHINNMLAGRENVLTKEKVLLLEPTSGTTTPTKYIPYTAGLQKEFNNAIQPWLAGLYLQWPGLFGCTQYWSLSPVLEADTRQKNSAVNQGFEDDTQYLGDKRSRLFSRIMAVPDIVKTCTTREAWTFLTAFFLLRDDTLGLISVWHPSFLTLLLQEIKLQAVPLTQAIETGKILLTPGMPESVKKKNFTPMPGRGKELKNTDMSAIDVFEKIWPSLQVISCWADDPGEPCLIELKKMFPNTWIQPKGIIATEGILSIPLGKHKGIPAYRSHFMEFIDTRNEHCKRLHELETDTIYEAVITTSGGLYRYRLNDLVKVTGWYKTMPQLKFVAKRNYVSDIRGEKLSVTHINDIHARFKQQFPGIEYFMVSPYIENTSACYVCFLLVKDKIAFPYAALLRKLEDELSDNYHYRHARKIKQLGPLNLYLLTENPTTAMIQQLETMGTKRGDIKLYALHRYTDWPSKLEGMFIQ